MSKEVKELGEPVEVNITSEIELLARFAVDEHNKKQNSQLEFRKAIKAWQQVVSGYTYTIDLETAEGGQYAAKVWVKPSPHSKELVYFKPLLTNDA